MLFATILRQLVDKEVHVELKSGMHLSGTLAASDQFANLLIRNPAVHSDRSLFAHTVGGRDAFIRGSAVQLIYQTTATEPALSLSVLANESRRRWASTHQGPSATSV